MNIKIIDDVISKEDQDKLEEIIILDSHVPFTIIWIRLILD